MTAELIEGARVVLDDRVEVTSVRILSSIENDNLEGAAAVATVLLVIALVDLVYFFLLSIIAIFPRLCYDERYKDTMCSPRIHHTFLVLLGHIFHLLIDYLCR